MKKDYDFNAINQNPLYMPDQTIAEKAGQYLSDLMADCDSSGGMIECISLRTSGRAGRTGLQ